MGTRVNFHIVLTCLCAHFQTSTIMRFFILLPLLFVLSLMVEGNFYENARISYLRKREAQEFRPHKEDSSSTLIFDGTQSIPKISITKVVRTVRPWVARPNLFFLPFEDEPISEG